MSVESGVEPSGDRDVAELGSVLLGAAREPSPPVSAAGERPEAQVGRLSETVRQLQEALDSRIVIEQARGVLMERFRLSIDEAFGLLRYSARTSRMSLRALAATVVASVETPAEILHGLARSERWRARLPAA